MLAKSSLLYPCHLCLLLLNIKQTGAGKGVKRGLGHRKGRRGREQYRRMERENSIHYITTENVWVSHKCHLTKWICLHGSLFSGCTNTCAVKETGGGGEGGGSFQIASCS